MKNQANHLIFFDSNCRLCRSSVKKIIQIDHSYLFCFAPLDGKTAQDFFKNKYKYLLSANSLVLVENFFKDSKRYWIRSRGFFRILWLLGGRYKILGWMYLFPAFLTDWSYKMVARHRHSFFNEKELSEFLTKEKKRFLP